MEVPLKILSIHLGISVLHSRPHGSTRGSGLRALGSQAESKPLLRPRRGGPAPFTAETVSPGEQGH